MPVIERESDSLPQNATLVEDLADIIPEDATTAYAMTFLDEGSDLLSPTLPWGRDLNQAPATADAAPSMAAHDSTRPACTVSERAAAGEEQTEGGRQGARRTRTRTAHFR